MILITTIDLTNGTILPLPIQPRTLQVLATYEGRSASLLPSWHPERCVEMEVDPTEHSHPSDQQKKAVFKKSVGRPVLVPSPLRACHTEAELAAVTEDLPPYQQHGHKESVGLKCDKPRISPVYAGCLQNIFKVSPDRDWEELGDLTDLTTPQGKSRYKPRNRGESSNAMHLLATFPVSSYSPRGIKISGWTLHAQPRSSRTCRNQSEKQGTLPRRSVPATKDRKFFPNIIREDFRKQVDLEFDKDLALEAMRRQEEEYLKERCRREQRRRRERWGRMGRREGETDEERVKRMRDVRRRVGRLVRELEEMDEQHEDREEEDREEEDGEGEDGEEEDGEEEDGEEEDGEEEDGEEEDDGVIITRPWQ